ncbi:MAG: flagellar basal body rod protein FlgB [Thermodesulfobacteriota bacterium]
MQIFDKSIDVLAKVLDLRVVRHDLLASNIANQDTPGYKAIDLDFEGAFQTSISREKAKLFLAKTDKRHFPSSSSFSPDKDVKVIQRPSNDFRYDQNNVKADVEMAKLTENALLYSASVRVLTHKFRRLAQAIRGGN